jgi:hypothetical protein
MEIWLGVEGTVRMLSRLDRRLDRVCDEDRLPRLPPLTTSQLLLKPKLQMRRPLPLQESARTPTGRLLLSSNRSLDDSPNTTTSLSPSLRAHHSLASSSINLRDRRNPDATQMPFVSPSVAWTFVIKPKLHHLKEAMVGLFKKKPQSSSSHNAKFAQAPNTHHHAKPKTPKSKASFDQAPNTHHVKAKPKTPKSKASHSHQSLKDLKVVPVPAPK